MAWRNVWRNRRRSLVTMSAMTLALFFMILWSGLMEGYIQSMERNITDLEMGDVQIYAAGYRDRPSLYTRIEAPHALAAAIRARGYRVTTRLLASGLAAAQETSAGVQLYGIDIETDATVSSIHQHIGEGQWLDQAHPTEVVLGKHLAHTLGATVGTQIIVLTQAANGSMANEEYRVRGILKSMGEGINRAGLFMSSKEFRQVMVMDQGVHQLIVRRPPSKPLGAAGQELSALGADLDVKTWQQLQPTLAKMHETQRGAMGVLITIVYIAIGIIILNAMLMAVFERIREFGIMKALGLGPLQVLGLIVTESGIMTGLSLALGVAVSIPSLAYLSVYGVDLSTMGSISVAGIAMDPIWRAAVSPVTFGQPVLLFIAIVFIAVLYPAQKAARLEAIDALRHH